MQCSVCGSENMFEISIIDNQVLATEGYVRQTVNSYACEDCGHIDLYAPKEVIDIHKKVVEFEKDRKVKTERLNEKIAYTNKHIAELQKIVSDENQTVKAVKEAQLKLKETDNELKELNRELNAVLCAREPFTPRRGSSGSLFGG